jgi:hypothetical protein
MKPDDRDPIEAECDALRTILYKGPSPAVHLRWQALWQEYVDGDKFKLTPVLTVQHLCDLGWCIGMIEGDYQAALNCLNPLFSHPKVEQADPLFLTLLKVNRISSLLFMREETQAIASVHLLITETPDSLRRVALLSPIPTRQFLYGSAAGSAGL